MNLVKFAATVLSVLQTWKEELAPEEVSTTPLPVIAVPPLWMKQARKEMQLSDDIESIYGCEVLVKDDIDVPVIVRHDGRALNLDNTWGKAAAKIQAAEERRDTRNRKRLILIH